MKTKHLLLVSLLISISSLGCQSRQSGVLYQVSTIKALQEAAYDGQVTISQLKNHGNMGIGTFDSLDGEMVEIDDKVYKCPAVGPLQQADPTDTTPFANIVSFEPTIRFSTSAQSMPALTQQLEKSLPTKNLFYAVRVDGEFEFVKVRTVPKQNRPFPRLAEVTAHQKESQYQFIKGTLVGFYCPQYAAGLNMPGWHMHFISDDRSAGGHLLEIKAKSAKVGIEPLYEVRMFLPRSGKFFQADLTKDTAAELEKIEGGK